MPDFENYHPEIPYGDYDNENPSADNDGTQARERLKGRRRSSGKPTEREQAKDKNNSKKKDKNNNKNSNDDDSVVAYFRNIYAALTGTTARLLFGIFIGLLGIYLLIAFVSYFTNCIKDQAIINNTPVGAAHPVGNAAGEGGARLSEFLINECFGLGSLVIIVWLIGISLKLLIGKPRFKTINFTIKCIIVLITVSLIIGLITIGFHTAVNWGGYHGRYVNQAIIDFVGMSGAVLVCIFLVAVFVAICLRDLIKWLLAKKRERDARKRAERERIEAEEERIEELRRMREAEHADEVRAGESVGHPYENEDISAESNVSFNNDEPLYAIDGDITDDEDTLDKKEDSNEEQILSEKPLGQDSNDKDSVNVDSTEGTLPKSDAASSDLKEVEEKSDAADSQTGETPEDDAEADKTADSMVVNVNEIEVTDKPRYKSELEFFEDHPYKFPPYSLLRPGKETISVDTREQLENKERIRKTLLDFKIPIVSIEATVGPTVTLYEIVPEKGVKIQSIRRLADDIALSLAAIGVRIIAPIPGKGTVGIEVANKDPQTVSMQTVIKSQKYQSTRYLLPVALGSTISNEVYIADLAKMPHLLVAGATGQGKSVGLNAIIASLLYSKGPRELKFVMIDPKQVEFSLYNKLRNHYMAMIPEEAENGGEPVITDMQKVEATLNSLCIEMDNRYTLLKNAHARNVEEYNAKIKANALDPNEGHRFLPYIVVVVDEFGDLIMVSGKNVEMPIARLAQKARAVGMHVIIATQRPSTNVITGIIKANFPARISFKVSSGVDSKTILDTSGAQQLIGRGDMLIFHNSEMMRVQCAFIDTPEVEALCEYVERQPYPTGPYILPEPTIEGADGEGMDAGPITDIDPLFEEVARSIVNSGTASTSSIQRRYSIGYNRAGKIMDQMERVGIVGPSQGGKPRTVLVDPMGLESILASM